MYEKLYRLWWSVGGVRSLPLKYFYFIMGMQCNPSCATTLAKWLWRKQCFACFSSTQTSAWKRIGPSGGLHLEGHVRIQDHLILPRGVCIWPRTPASEGLSLLGRYWHEKQSLWSQGNWVRGCPPLKSPYSWQAGWLTVFKMTFATEVAWRLRKELPKV